MRRGNKEAAGPEGQWPMLMLFQLRRINISYDKAFLKKLFWGVRPALPRGLHPI